MLLIIVVGTSHPKCQFNASRTILCVCFQLNMLNYPDAQQPGYMMQYGYGQQSRWIYQIFNLQILNSCIKDNRELIRPQDFLTDFEHISTCVCAVHSRTYFCTAIVLHESTGLLLSVQVIVLIYPLTLLIRGRLKVVLLGFMPVIFRACCVMRWSPDS